MNSMHAWGTVMALFLTIQTCLGQDVWQRLPNAPVAGEHQRFDDVFFIDASTGWIVNVGESKIYKTSDGGNSWTLQLDARARFGYHVGSEASALPRPKSVGRAI